ncbi:MAG: XrtA-associated tyrosine autokinase [Burkholderiaceae bacterium]
MSLIERAIQRMDEVPAAHVPSMRADPVTAAVAEDLELFAESEAVEGRRQQRVQPTIDGPREPQMRAVPNPAPEDDWSAPLPGVPLSDDFDGVKPTASHSKTVTIDLQRLREGGMIAPDGDKTPLAEEFRVIKRPLLKNAFGGGAKIRNGNLIMVTSAFPREGKSFCAINLAMSIAMERDRTVLLVDADVARPSIPQKFGIAPDVGLMDVLLDSHVSLSDAIVRTNVNKLALLPAGRPHRQATELLASEAMAELLAELSERYSDRIVIFDSPPLLVTTEARTLAANMGQIVMVVESDNTTHEALREALATIESCDVVGMVLNKGRRSNPGDSYGYYGY